MSFTKYIYVVKERIYTLSESEGAVHDAAMDAIVIDQQITVKNEISLAVGDRLKKLRIKAGLSQEELAFEASVDKTFISSIERGIANPSVQVLANLCFGLNMTLEEFFQTLSVSMKPSETLRRINAAKVTLKPKRPRLR